MCIDVDISCACDNCGANVYADDAIVLCEECYEKVAEGIFPGYHLIANDELFCHKQKSTIHLCDCDDRIIFCSFCGDRLVK